MADNSEFYTVAEAARFLRVSRLTLKNWRDRGEGPPWVRIGPRMIRYRHSSLLEYLRDLESI